MTGTGLLYTGAAVAVGAAVVAAFVKGVRGWVRVVAVVLALVCIGNTISVQVQLNHKRAKLRHILDNFPTFTPPS